MQSTAKTIGGASDRLNRKRSSCHTTKKVQQSNRLSRAASKPREKNSASPNRKLRENGASVSAPSKNGNTVAASPAASPASTSKSSLQASWRQMPNQPRVQSVAVSRRDPFFILARALVAARAAEDRSRRKIISKVVLACFPNVPVGCRAPIWEAARQLADDDRTICADLARLLKSYGYVSGNRYFRDALIESLLGSTHDLATALGAAHGEFGTPFCGRSASDRTVDQMIEDRHAIRRTLRDAFINLEAAADKGNPESVKGST